MKGISTRKSWLINSNFPKETGLYEQACFFFIYAFALSAVPALAKTQVPILCYHEVDRAGDYFAVSHTHALHKQRAIAPQGGASGIAANRLYLNGRYETDEEYEKRLNDDMAETQRLFEEKLGHPAKAMVWPYGMCSGASIRAAKAHGMQATFLLDGGINEVEPSYMTYARRIIMGDNITVKKLTDNKISLVALQAFADPDGDGNYDKVYFYNKQVPMAADAFNDVCNALQQEGIKVVAWLPALTCQTDGSNLVQAAPAGKAGWYQRLSPFDETSTAKAADLFRDLGRYTLAEGVLGLWNPAAITDDIEMTWRLETHFWDIRYEPNMLCWMLVPETLKGLWRQRLRWGWNA